MMQYVKPRRQRILSKKHDIGLIKQCAQHSIRPYIRSRQFHWESLI